MQLHGLIDGETGQHHHDAENYHGAAREPLQTIVDGGGRGVLRILK
jgi:hypothetical protein